MATVQKEIVIRAPAANAWDAVRDYGALQERLVPGFVTNTRVERGGAFRVVTFADGLVLRERIVTLDDENKRFAYAIVGEPFEHHHATVHILDDESGCKMVWTADMKPDDLADNVSDIMEQGISLAKSTIEAAAEGSASTGEGLPVFCSATDGPTLHHASLFVSHLDASVEFYVSGLGLALRERFDDIVGERSTGRFSFGVASVFLEAGKERYIELHPAEDGPMQQPGFPLNHLAFGVADVDEAYSRALKAGAIAISIPVPHEHWDGTPLDVVMTGKNAEPMRMAFLQGPDGELIELYESASPDSQ